MAIDGKLGWKPDSVELEGEINVLNCIRSNAPHGLFYIAFFYLAHEFIGRGLSEGDGREEGWAPIFQSSELPILNVPLNYEETTSSPTSIRGYKEKL